jgi:hypothetical protein
MLSGSLPDKTTGAKIPNAARTPAGNTPEKKAACLPKKKGQANKYPYLQLPTVPG